MYASCLIFKYVFIRFISLENQFGIARFLTMYSIIFLLLSSLKCLKFVPETKITKYKYDKRTNLYLLNNKKFSKKKAKKFIENLFLYCLKKS